MRSTDGSGDHAGPSRRWFLAGGVATVVGGGAGVGAGFLQPGSTRRPSHAAADLTAAIAAELQLLALVAAGARRDPALRSSAAVLTRDHTAHLRALRTAAAAYERAVPAPAPTPTPATPPATASVRDQLRTAERAAAAAAAARAARLTGAAAVLLASISACESTHVELLS